MELRPVPHLTSERSAWEHSPYNPAMTASTSGSSVYSAVGSGQTVRSLESPEYFSRVNRQAANELLQAPVPDPLQDVANQRREAARSILREQLGLNTVPFFAITEQNSMEVAGDILARRVLHTTLGSTNMEKINAWMNWLNATWDLHQQVRDADESPKGKASTQQVEQLRDARRGQLRLFLDICNEGNILGFGPGCPRPQTDDQLDQFINSNRFALLVAAIRNVYEQIKHADARGSGIEINYSTPSS